MKLNKTLGILSIFVVAAGALVIAPKSAMANYDNPTDTINGTTLFTFIDPAAGGTSPLVYSGAGSSASYVQDAAGNLFTFTSDSTGLGSFEEKTIGGNDLLSGTFTGLANLGGAHTSTAFISLTVDYLGGADLSDLNGGVPGDSGSVTLSLTNPTVEAGTPANSYVYDSYGTTFGLTPNTATTPEPSPAIAIAIATLGLGGLLMFRKKSVSTLS